MTARPIRRPPSPMSGGGRGVWRGADPGLGFTSRRPGPASEARRRFPTGRRRAISSGKIFRSSRMPDGGRGRLPPCGGVRPGRPPLVLRRGQGRAENSISLAKSLPGAPPRMRNRADSMRIHEAFWGSENDRWCSARKRIWTWAGTGAPPPGGERQIPHAQAALRALAPRIHSSGILGVRPGSRPLALALGR